jgi:hypothetical protein
MKKSQEVAVVDQQMLAELKEMYPTEIGNFTRISLPRIGFASQDVVEGKGKASKVTVEAGTFFIEKQTEETDAEGKKIWSKEEIGKELEGIILYHRYQLSFYDEAKEEYSSTPVYDSQDEVLPLFCAKKQIAKGTPKELKALYKFVGEDGKEKSKLKDNRIVYVLMKDELYQLNLHGSSMYSFMKYGRTVVPPSVITKFTSEPQVKGKIEWNMMMFTSMRPIHAEEAADIVSKVKEIKLAIQLEKGVQQEVATKYVEEKAKADESFEKW